MPKLLLEVPYAEQKSNIWCGAACLQMLLEFLRVKPPGNNDEEKQQSLFEAAEVLERNDPDAITWYSQPDALEKTLERKTSLDPLAVSVVEAQDHAGLERAIVRSLINELPPVVATLAAGHWLLVVGCSVSRMPADATDTDFELESVDLHDPSRNADVGWDAPPPPPPVHVTAKAFRGVRYAKFPVPLGSRWQDRFLAIGAAK